MKNLFVLTLILSGCATNGVTVHEKTVEGYEFSMTQRTTSTIFASTEDGAGSVDYEGESPDGSKFNLRAGAAVAGQKGGDPSNLIEALVNAVIQKSEPTPPPKRDVASELAEIRAMLEALQR